MTTESSKNGAIALSHMHGSIWICWLILCSWQLTTACCLVVGLGLGLGVVTGWLMVMHTYIHCVIGYVACKNRARNFTLSLSLSLLRHEVGYCGIDRASKHAIMWSQQAPRWHAITMNVMTWSPCFSISDTVIDCSNSRNSTITWPNTIVINIIIKIIIIITTTIFIVVSYTAPCSHMREFTVVPLGQSRSASSGRQLVGQAANLTFESACRLL